MKKTLNLQFISLAVAVAGALALSPALGGNGDYMVGGIPPDPNGSLQVVKVHFGAAPYLSTQVQPLGPNSLVMYESRWLELPAHLAVDSSKVGSIASTLGTPSKPWASGLVLRYCVFPSIAIHEIVRPIGSPASPPWDASFTLKLVELGSPKTTPNFAPIQVNGPIPANTTRALGPTWPPSSREEDPKPWCGQTAPGAPLPILYLVVNGRPEVKVIWADPPLMVPITGSPAAPSLVEPAITPSPASNSPR